MEKVRPEQTIQENFAIMQANLNDLAQNVRKLKAHLVELGALEELDAKKRYMELKRRMGQLIELLQNNIAEIQERKNSIDGSR